MAQLKYINKSKLRKIIFLAFSMLLISLFFPIKMMIFIAASIYFNAIVSNYNLRTGLPTEFELSTFTTIIAASSYGLKYGIFVAVISKLAACIYNGSFIIDHIFMILNYCIAAFIAYTFSGISIVPLGIMITLLNNTTMFFISKHLGISLSSNISYVMTNIAFNFLLFTIFGNILHIIL